MDLKVKYVNEILTTNNWKLQHAKAGDVGMDLVSVEDIIIPAGEFRKVATGIALEIPYGNFVSLQGRSGLASKKGIGVLGGVIDQTYRGEICAILMNNGKEDFVINKMDRVVQMLILPYVTCQVEVVAELASSIRGDAGFGSTGLK